MRCPICAFPDSKVVDSRPAEDGASIRRRRECQGCGYRFTTYERLGDSPFIVVKTDGSIEAYSRDKLRRGLLKACAKRPVQPESIDRIIDDIESDLREGSNGRISSHDLGELALARLRTIDEVAYVRFASVYRDFQSVEGFREELDKLL